jgi:hypothetical protein
MRPLRRAGTSAVIHSKQTGKKPMSVIRSEKPAEVEIEEDRSIATVSEVENDIREFVRNDVAYLRRPGATPALGTSPATSTTGSASDASEAAVANVNSLIQRVAGASLSEIGKLIDELENLRDLLHSEGQRVQREISGYSQLSQAAMKSTRMIADNVTQWKTQAENLHKG